MDRGKAKKAKEVDLLPKKAKIQRVSIEEKQQRLKLWLAWADTFQEMHSREPPMESFEKTQGWQTHTIRRLLKCREELETARPPFVNSMSRLIRRPLYALEVVLVEVIKDVRDRRLPVDAILLRALAHDTYTTLHNRMGGMPFPRPEFGKTWVELFKAAWGLDYYKMTGEAGSVDLQAIAKDIDRLIAIIAEYALEDVYNADETGLFLQTLSPWTLDFLRRSGIKSIASRISILFCVNALGTDKLKPFMLSKEPCKFMYFFSYLLKTDLRIYMFVCVRHLPSHGVQDR